MTQKDYIALAQAISDSIHSVFPKVRDSDETFAAAGLTFGVVIAEISKVLELDNPRFDEDRFMTACLFTLGGTALHPYLDTVESD